MKKKSPEEPICELSAHINTYSKVGMGVSVYETAITLGCLVARGNVVIICLPGFEEKARGASCYDTAKNSEVINWLIFLILWLGWLEAVVHLKFL